jgi:hypothetical protein
MREEAETMKLIITTVGVVPSGAPVVSAQGFTLPKRPRALFAHLAPDVASGLCGPRTS